jgi:hypothetical protein
LVTISDLFTNFCKKLNQGQVKNDKRGIFVTILEFRPKLSDSSCLIPGCLSCFVEGT